MRDGEVYLIRFPPLARGEVARLVRDGEVYLTFPPLLRGGGTRMRDGEVYLIFFIYFLFSIKYHLIYYAL